MTRGTPKHHRPPPLSWDGFLTVVRITGSPQAYSMEQRPDGEDQFAEVRCKHVITQFCGPTKSQEHTTVLIV